MPRGRNSFKKREVEADPIYKSQLLTKFINRTMRDGKKTTAQRAVYGAMDIIKEKGEDPMKVFQTALENVGPIREVKARRIGGAAYQVPTEVRGDRRMSLAIRWVLEATNKRPNAEFRSFSAKLAAELMDASKEEGAAVKKRETVHKMAEANKAFGHFRW